MNERLMTRSGAVLASSQNRRVLDHLIANRPSLLHAVDPFKVPLEQAAEKVRAVQQHGFPAIILASTDWEDFGPVIDRYVARIREVAPGMPILLHFPPRHGCGMPMVAAADATLYPFLLGSTEPYFAWMSYAETVELLASSASGQQQLAPELIHLAALTFGRDGRSNEVMSLNPIQTTRRSLELIVEMIRILGLQGAYLFSRHERVPDWVCRYFRDHLPPGKVLFVSGGVRTAEKANRFFDSGADFVVFCGALECASWRTVLEGLVLAGPGRAAESGASTRSGR